MRFFRESHHIIFAVLVVESNGILIFSYGKLVVQRRNLPFVSNSATKIISPKVLFLSVTDRFSPLILQSISVLGLAVGLGVAVAVGLAVGFNVGVGLGLAQVNVLHFIQVKRCDFKPFCVFREKF